jgi:hypothetical protein
MNKNKIYKAIAYGNITLKGVYDSDISANAVSVGTSYISYQDAQNKANKASNLRAYQIASYNKNIINKTVSIIKENIFQELLNNILQQQQNYNVNYIQNNSNNKIDFNIDNYKPLTNNKTDIKEIVEIYYDSFKDVKFN